MLLLMLNQYLSVDFANSDISRVLPLISGVYSLWVYLGLGDPQRTEGPLCWCPISRSPNIYEEIIYDITRQIYRTAVPSSSHIFSIVWWVYCTMWRHQCRAVIGCIMITRETSVRVQYFLLLGYIL